MTGLGSVGALFAGTFAVALAAPAVVAAFLERPPQGRFPRPLVLALAAWSLAFLIAALLVTVGLGRLAVGGLLIAACELAAAAAIWTARAASFGEDDGDGGGGGGRRSDEPQDPGGGIALPDECWAHWEEQFDKVETLPG